MTGLHLFGISALLLANLPLADAYEHLWQIRWGFEIIGHPLSLTLHQWTNDGLMAVFFCWSGWRLNVSWSLANWRLLGSRFANSLRDWRYSGFSRVVLDMQSEWGERARLGHPDRYHIAFYLGALA